MNELTGIQQWVLDYITDNPNQNHEEIANYFEIILPDVDRLVISKAIEYLVWNLHADKNAQGYITARER